MSAESAAAAAAPAAAQPSASVITNGETLSAGLLAVVKPSIHHLSQRLLELQESQAMLVHTITAQKAEIMDKSEEWKAAQVVLDRLPEYQAKVARIKRMMASTQVLLAKVDKGSAALRSKVEDRDKERASKKTADVAGFSSVKA